MVKNKIMLLCLVCGLTSFTVGCVSSLVQVEAEEVNDVSIMSGESFSYISDSMIVLVSGYQSYVLSIVIDRARVSSGRLFLTGSVGVVSVDGGRSIEPFVALSEADTVLNVCSSKLYIRRTGDSAILADTNENVFDVIMTADQECNTIRYGKTFSCSLDVTESSVVLFATKSGRILGTIINIQQLLDKGGYDQGVRP